MRTFFRFNRFTRIVLALSMVIGPGTACKSKTSPSASTTYDGTWRGPGASGGASANNIGVVTIEFVVQNNSITRLTLTMRLVPGTAGCSFVSNTSSAISGTSFSYGFVSGTVTSTITGNFTSLTAGSGVVGRIDFANIQCSGTLTGFASGDNVTFTKQ